MGVLSLDEKVDLGDMSSLDWERKGGGMVVADLSKKEDLVKVALLLRGFFQEDPLTIILLTPPCISLLKGQNLSPLPLNPKILSS